MPNAEQPLIYLATILDRADFQRRLDRRAFATRNDAAQWASRRADYFRGDGAPHDLCDPDVTLEGISFVEADPA